MSDSVLGWISKASLFFWMFLCCAEPALLKLLEYRWKAVVRDSTVDQAELIGVFQLLTSFALLRLKFVEADLYSRLLISRLDQKSSLDLCVVQD